MPSAHIFAAQSDAKVDRVDLVDLHRQLEVRHLSLILTFAEVWQDAGKVLERRQARRACGPSSMEQFFAWAPI
jgi:hypothetical protein